MFRGLVTASLLCHIVVGAKVSSCGAEQSRIKQLESKILALEKDLAQANAAGGENQRISLTKIGSQCAAFSNDVVRHALKSTNFDDKKIYDHVSNSATAAREGATALHTGIMNKVSSFNYEEHYQSLQQSTAFQTLLKKSEILQPHIDKVKPHLEKARQTMQPVFEKAAPVFEKARAMCEPVFAKTVETCSLAHGHFQEKFIPALRSGGSQTLDSVFGAGLMKLDRVLQPVYEKAGSIAPQHKAILPEHPIDRVLFIVILVFFAYYGLYIGRIFLRLALKFLKKTTLMSFWVFRVLVMLPLQIVLKVISWTLWVATGFYCCGLCAKKKGSKHVGIKKNGNGSQDATVSEIEKTLKQAQQKKNEDKAVKLLSGLVKSGKPMTQPKTLEGKLVKKEVLLEACKKLGIKAGI